jgi:hypothetical protein
MPLLISRLCRGPALAVCLLLAACGREAGAEHTLWESGLGSRQFALTEWDTLWSRGGEADSVLLNPFLLSADGELLYVYDAGRDRVVSFDARDGSLRWTFGRQGAGPDEFRGVRDLKVDGRGGVYVLDARNNRIVHLSDGGTVLRRIPLDAVGHAEQMAPIGGGRVALLTMSPESPFVILDSMGGVEERFSLPWDGFTRLDQLARQGYIASRGERWAFGFSIGNGWFAFRGEEPEGEVGRYVEHTEFPGVTTTAVGEVQTTTLEDYNACSACSMAMSDSVLYVHFGGYTDHRRRIVDRYRLRDAAYLGSLRLPHEATVVEVGGERVFALYEDPYPGIVALRARPPSR